MNEVLEVPQLRALMPAGRRVRAAPLAPDDPRLPRGARSGGARARGARPRAVGAEPPSDRTVALLSPRAGDGVRDRPPQRRDRDRQERARSGSGEARSVEPDARLDRGDVRKLRRSASRARGLCGLLLRDPQLLALPVEPGRRRQVDDGGGDPRSRASTTSCGSTRRRRRWSASSGTATRRRSRTPPADPSRKSPSTFPEPPPDPLPSHPAAARAGPGPRRAHVSTSLVATDSLATNLLETVRVEHRNIPADEGVSTRADRRFGASDGNEVGEERGQPQRAGEGGSTRPSGR